MTLLFTLLTFQSHKIYKLYVVTTMLNERALYEDLHVQHAHLNCHSSLTYNNASSIDTLSLYCPIGIIFFTCQIILQYDMIFSYLEFTFKVQKELLLYFNHSVRGGFMLC